MKKETNHEAAVMKEDVNDEEAKNDEAKKIQKEAIMMGNCAIKRETIFERGKRK